MPAAPEAAPSRPPRLCRQHEPPEDAAQRDPLRGGKESSGNNRIGFAGRLESAAATLAAMLSDYCRTTPKRRLSMKGAAGRQQGAVLLRRHLGIGREPRLPRGKLGRRKRGDQRGNHRIQRGVARSLDYCGRYHWRGAGGTPAPSSHSIPWMVSASYRNDRLRLARPGAMPARCVRRTAARARRPPGPPHRPRPARRRSPRDCRQDRPCR